LEEDSEGKSLVSHCGYTITGFSNENSEKKTRKKKGELSNLQNIRRYLSLSLHFEISHKIQWGGSYSPKAKTSLAWG